MPPPQMTILNAPLRDSCVARRERTNTPSQALLLLNESEYIKAARQLALTALNEPADQRLNLIWETVTSRLPDEQETAVMQQLLADLTETYSSDLALADQLCEGANFPADQLSDQPKAELAAWTVLGNVLFNLDIVKTKD
jgi:hypothetical protein